MEGTADILLVEDSLTDAQLILRALERAGFQGQVEQVSDGVEALDFISQTELFAPRNYNALPKLILLDLKLHQLGGLGVLRRLKSAEQTRNIPIVVFTGSRRQIEIMESYKLGVNSYVLKPTEAEEFARVVALIGQYWLQINEPPATSGGQGGVMLKGAGNSAWH